MERFSSEFDATRSTGHLCAATVENFEQVRLAIPLEEIISVIVFSSFLCLEGVATRMLWNESLNMQ